MFQRISRGLALAALLAAARTPAQENPYQALRNYDGQNRTAQAAIQKAIQQAGLNQSALLPIETGLIGVIQDREATLAGKRDACRFLWMIGTRKSVPALSRLLSAPETSDLAVYALSRNPDPSAGAALRSAAATTTGHVRVGIVNALGNRSDAAAVPLLRRFAAANDPILAGAATAALGKIATPSAVAVLRTLPTGSAAAGEALVRAAEVLARSGARAKAESIYLAVAVSKRPGVPRGAALVGLARVNAPKAAETALGCLRASDPYLAVVAARVCGSIDSPSSTRRAVALFPSLSPPVQTALLAAWSDRREHAAASIAIKALGAADPIVRATAIRSAGRIAGSRAVSPLVAIASTGEGRDREYARQSLTAMPSREADDALLGLARSGSSEVRAMIMGILAERPGARNRAVLLSTAAGPDSAAAQAALKGLAQVASPQDYPALVKVLVNARDEGVRDAAREAVVAVSRQMPNEAAAAAPLVEAMKSASDAGRIAVMPALAEIGGDSALAALETAARSDNPDLKQAAVGALSDACSDRRALPILIGLAKGDPSRSIRVQALRGYIRLAGSVDRVAPDERVAWLKSALDAAERPEEKRQAMGALRQCRVVSAVDVVAPYLDDADLFPDAAATIVALASKQDNRPGVQGPTVDAALDKIVSNAKDEKLREDARKLRGQ